MKRRTLIKSASGAIALASHGAMLEVFGQSGGAGALEKIFQNPPADAGLSIVHHWTGGVVTKEGITADMEGMAASGINIVNWFYFDGSGTQDGVQVYPCKSPEWWDLVNHLMSEAKRVGITVAPHVCSIWGPSGTEGITPELSAQILVSSEAEAEVTITAAQKAAGKRLLLDLGNVQNLARVRLNDKDLGVLWKAPYVADITAATIVGANKLELEVTNTWANRIAGDEGKPQEQRVTWAGSAGRGRGGGAGQPSAGTAPQLLLAGLIGPVRIVTEVLVPAT